MLRENNTLTDERLYNLAVSFIPGIGDINAKKLIASFGNAEAVFKSSLKDLIRVPGIGEQTALRLHASFSDALQSAEDELLYIYANEIEFVCYADDNYPARLRDCDDSPVVLYYKGNPDFNAKKIISIVGTRKATKYGTEIVAELVKTISERYPETVIVSGLAYGIDISAHKEALRNNLATWGVMGHSLEFIYPAIHKKIAQQMTEASGAIISDFPHGSKTDPSNFVKRNRIVAGISDALIVVESGTKGGSIITANIANHYNRDVFAVPGCVKSSLSQGCNRLIKTNRANLLESFDDIEYIMNWTCGKPTTLQNTLSLLPQLTENEQLIVNILKNHDYLDIDNIYRQTNIDSNTLSMNLLELEFKNIIRALPGKIFSLKLK